jgi:hypothetical protein
MLPMRAWTPLLRAVDSKRDFLKPGLDQGGIAWRA